MSIDLAKENFQLISAEIGPLTSETLTEEDTRYKIIDRILRNVLFWPDRLIRTEPHTESGYIDYLLQEEGRSLILIEAKRVRNILLDTKMPGTYAYNISGPALKSAREAIVQAENYCYKVGAPICAITNGFEWIAHWLIRGDGRSPMEYKAITFPDLKSISDDFALFYDVFSYPGLQNKLFKSHFMEYEVIRVAFGEKLRPIRDIKGIKTLPKSELTRDLDAVFKAFFSSMSGETDPEMLAQCFVESKESKNAEAGLEKLARNIIENIQMVSDERSHRLEREIQDAVNTSSKEFVLIVGNKGSGKSTFIDRFFDLRLEKTLRNKCLLIRVDLRDSDGNANQIQSWLDTKLVEATETALFGDKLLEYEDLQGVFHRQYQQWAQGEFKHLYSTDKTAFKIKFGQYVHEIKEKDKRKYLTALLWHATGARQLMPCLVFDNTDHYPQLFQESVFVYAQAVHRSSFTFVICPITDRTIWQLSKFRPLQSYEAKAFYLPVPSTKEILEKRIEFIKNKTSISSKQGEQYFLKKGIRLSVSDINAFAACVESVFVETEYVSRTISWLCNHDIRRTLGLTQKVLSSPHVSIDDLVKTYLSGNRLRIKEYDVRKALFLGDHDKFSQDHSNFVMNMFSVSGSDITTPLARLSILQLLKDKDATKDDSDQAYMAAGSIYAYFDGIGINFHATQGHLAALLKFRCIEPYDPTTEVINDQTLIRITNCGLIHMEFCLGDHTYLEHVGLSTEVRENRLIDDIRQRLTGHHFNSDDWAYVTRQFARYCADQDLMICNIPSNMEGQKQMRHDFCWQWGVTA